MEKYEERNGVGVPRLLEREVDQGGEGRDGVADGLWTMIEYVVLGGLGMQNDIGH